MRKGLAEFNKNAQNNFFYVKIGLWILTTDFTKQIFEKPPHMIQYFKGL